jgi:voltage-gated potassium channel Kch
MVAGTVVAHFWGLLLLSRVLQDGHKRMRQHVQHLRRPALMLLVVFGIFALHTIEIWPYAALYRSLGELQNFEEALYFSTVTFVSLGYGDVVLSPRWRLLSAVEAANGVILIAWSTAFLVSVTRQLRLIEHDWLQEDP